MDDLDLDHRIRAALQELEPLSTSAPSPERIRARANRRRRQRRWTPVAFAVLAALIAGILYFRPGPATTVQTTGPAGLPAGTGSATVADLEAGQWSQWPPDPVSAPSAFIWTGTELLTWGSTATPPVQTDFTKGAAYQPSSQAWQAIAPAPFPVPQGDSVSVWTGKEVIFLGSAPRGAGTDGAAYNPTTNRWRTLPTSPLNWGTRFAVWTGDRVMAFGTIGTGSAPPGGVAAYDPATNGWTTIGLPKPPVEHGVRWLSAVTIGGRILAWSGWQITSTAGPSRPGAGVDLYAYDEGTGHWSFRPPTNNAMVDADMEFWTGNTVFVMGLPYLCNCGPGGPLETTVVGSYDPASNKWTRLPTLTGPGYIDPGYLWTGAALVAIGEGDPSPLMAYGAAGNQWQALPSAPGTSCLDNVWTGTQLVLFCNGVGLALTPAVATPAVPSSPPTASSPLPAGTRPAMPTS